MALLYDGLVHHKARSYMTAWFTTQRAPVWRHKSPPSALMYDVIVNRTALFYLWALLYDCRHNEIIEICPWESECFSHHGGVYLRLHVLLCQVRVKLHQRHYEDFRFFHFYYLFGFLSRALRVLVVLFLEVSWYTSVKICYLRMCTYSRESIILTERPTQCHTTCIRCPTYIKRLTHCCTCTCIW